MPSLVEMSTGHKLQEKKMIKFEYTATTSETAAAALDFMTNRPILAAMFKFMQYACIILCIVFVASLITSALRPQDYIAMICAILWLFFYKHINRAIIRMALNRRKFADMHCICKFDEKSILFSMRDFTPQHIEWKKIRFILKNKSGYIIPLTGLANAGRFMWLPLRSMQKPGDEQAFLGFIEQFKIKIRNL